MDNILPVLQAHCQSPTSQRFSQSFVKELAKPAQEKNFKIFLPLFKDRIKTHKYMDRQEPSMHNWIAPHHLSITGITPLAHCALV